MVDLFPAIGVIADNVFVYLLATKIRPTNPLDPTSVLTVETAEKFDLPDVVSESYVTVFSASIGIEDVGFLEVLSLFVDLFWQIKGKGNTRWQVSGDGGLSFVTIHEFSPDFDTGGVFITQERGGTGTWLTDSVQPGIDILPGDDKFQIRLQSRITAGSGSTLSSKLDDSTLYVSSYLSLQYRRKITTET